MQKAQVGGSWDRHVTALTSRVLSGGAILPIQEASPTTPRKSIIYAQKGVSMRVNEAQALVDAIMDGKAHRDYVTVGGSQYVITSVMESAYYGKATSSSTGGGLVLVKTRRVLILATYADPVTAAEAIPHTHRFADSLEALLSEI